MKSRKDMEEAALSQSENHCNKDHIEICNIHGLWNHIKHCNKDHIEICNIHELWNHIIF